MVAPTKFAHIVYRTRRFEEMITWYQIVFEAKVQYQNPLLAFLTYDDEHHRFAFIDMAKIQPAGGVTDRPDDSGVDHVAYTYASLGDLLETYTRLKQHDIVPFWPVHHGVTLSFYYRDPDGNRMELQIDCFATAEEGTAYMYSPAFNANPVGVWLDPDHLVEQYRNGVPEAELLKRPDGPVSKIPHLVGTP